MNNIPHHFHQKPTTSNQGFTIVELLVVIAVIVLLAAITLASYSGVRREATESAMRTDITNARNAIAILKGGSKNYPTTADAANNGQGLTQSAGTHLDYGGFGTEYCVTASNPGTLKTYRLLSTVGTIEEGNCGAIVSTFAGTYDSPAPVDGTGTAGTFSYPSSIDKDSSGNLYVGDSRTVRKITPEGVVTTIAGQHGVNGYVNGDALTEALFTFIQGIAVADDGTIYVAEYGSLHYGIRKISPEGVVSTVAGTNTRGLTEGPGATAQFYDPYGMALDSAGNLYVADGIVNQRIRMITPEGIVSTFAGSTPGYADGNGSSAQFFYPNDIVIDEDDNLYIADGGNACIRKITPSADVTTIAGECYGETDNIDGPALDARFDYLTGIDMDDEGNIYVFDSSGRRVRKLSTDGMVTTVAGSGEYGMNNGIGMYASFTYSDNGLAVDGSGNIYVADSYNEVIRKIVP